MRASIYLNSENIEDAVLDPSFASRVKALTLLKRLPAFTIYADVESFTEVKSAMNGEKKVMGALTLLLQILNNEGREKLDGQLFEVDIATGTGEVTHGHFSRLRGALFADRQSDHTAACVCDNRPDRYICLLYNDFSERPQARIFRESANPWRLLVEAFVEAILPRYWDKTTLSELYQNENFRKCVQMTIQCELQEYECRDALFQSLLPNNKLAACSFPDLEKTAHQGSSGDKIALMKEVSVDYAFINGWYENHHLSSKNRRKVFESIFRCDYYLALDTQHFDFEVHFKSDGSHYGSFSIPKGIFKKAKGHRLEL